MPYICELYFCLYYSQVHKSCSQFHASCIDLLWHLQNAIFNCFIYVCRPYSCHRSTYQLVCFHVGIASNDTEGTAICLPYFQLWFVRYLDVCHHCEFFVCMTSLCLFLELHWCCKTSVLKILGFLMAVVAIIHCLFLCLCCVHVYIFCCGMLTPNNMAKSCN